MLALRLERKVHTAFPGTDQQGDCVSYLVFHIALRHLSVKSRLPSSITSLAPLDLRRGRARQKYPTHLLPQSRKHHGGTKASAFSFPILSPLLFFFSSSHDIAAVPCMNIKDRKKERKERNWVDCPYRAPAVPPRDEVATAERIKGSA